MKDILSRADIDTLMQNFYQKVMKDPLIGYIFTDVAKLNLEKHLPIIGDFWDSVLFNSGKYQKHQRNPMLVHLELNRKTQLKPEHFDRWLVIFNETIDELFSGANAELIKSRAAMIAERMQIVLANQQNLPGIHSVAQDCR
ncbi:MAG: group III truncated hemoglobin [Acidobacteria bacterium]|nr:MAG: group III truncated hemoglobin [Acidobacteriota bacterium]